MSAHRAGLRAGVAPVPLLLLLADPRLAMAEDSPPPLLTRVALVQAVLDANPELRASSSMASSSLAMADAVSAPDPMVELGAAPLSFVPGGGALPGLSAEVSQRVPIAGQVGLGADAARAMARGAAAEADGMRIRLAYEASTLFDDWWVIHQVLVLNTEHHALVSELRTSATGRYTVGQAPQAAPLEAEVMLARLERDRIALTAEQRLLAARIDALLHLPPETPVGPPADPDPPAGPVRAPDPTRRPDLVALDSAVDGAQVALSLARRWWTPDLALSTGVSTMWPMPEMRWMVGVGGDVPVHPGARKAEVTAAAAELDAARSRLDSAEDAARVEVFAAEVDATAAAERWQLHQDRLLPAARQRLDAARIAFETGSGGFDDAVDAERDLLDAELGAIEATADFHRALAALDAAAGRIPAGGDR